MTLACRDCGTLVELPAPDTAGTSYCPVCAHALRRSAGRGVAAALACALTTFALLWPANLLPMMGVTMLGMHTQSGIFTSVQALWDGHWVIIAVLTALFVMVLPFVRFGLLSGVLLCVKAGRRPRWLGRAFRWSLWLDHWAMPDVFLIGCLVGYSRVRAFLPTTIEAGGWCVIAAALIAMITRASLDTHAVWHWIETDRTPPADQPAIACAACSLVLPAARQGHRCPRCGLRLRARKPHATTRTAMFVIAGLILYLPANFFPMNVDIQMGQITPHRIADGIQDLINAHLWWLAVLIFVTSIAIPALKLLGLTWFLFSIRRRSRRHLRLKTRLYRVINEIGRWSNVDVFTVAVFLPLIQFGALAHTDVAVGSVAFMLVVVCTMVASRAFDPRLMWDAALEAPNMHASARNESPPQAEYAS
ncbi:MAG: paraquat-inducible protein A [Nevskiaceae bacterium]|nr:MAG: paraquat-inducible protein A [Nevskiaceae bacterium]TBR74179.1 MAG: paraquat-inducible protein A [Nevskiaceae bacterium]